MNVVMLSGSLTRDPEMRYTPKGQPVCEATLAYRSTRPSRPMQRRRTTFRFDPRQKPQNEGKP